MALSSTTNGARQVYGAQGSPVQSNFPPPIVATRDPTSSDINYTLGREWINKSTPALWFLGAKASGAATWIAAGSGTSGGLVTVTASSGGALSPVAGNMNFLGTANQITSAGAGHTVTFTLPAAIIAPGSIVSTTTIASTTTMTAGTGFTATTGNIVASAGNISATLGSVAAGTTVTGGTGVVATTGNVSATAGAVNAGTSMTATAGNITATLGNVVINGAAKQLQVHGGAATDFIGTATLVNGVATVSNTNIATTDRIFVARSAKNASTAYGNFQVVKTAATNFVITACKSDTTTETNDQSTVEYFIVRQV